MPAAAYSPPQGWCTYCRPRTAVTAFPRRTAQWLCLLLSRPRLRKGDGAVLHLHAAVYVFVPLLFREEAALLGCECVFVRVMLHAFPPSLSIVSRIARWMKPLTLPPSCFSAWALILSLISADVNLFICRAAAERRRRSPRACRLPPVGHVLSLPCWLPDPPCAAHWRSRSAEAVHTSDGR